MLVPLRWSALRALVEVFQWWYVFVFLIGRDACACSQRIEIDDSLVQVHDNVLDAAAAKWLHEECVKWTNPKVTSIFPLQNDPSRYTPIQQFLDRILHQLHPGTTEPKYYVEFWQRTEWQHIPAHADIDGTNEARLHCLFIHSF